LTAVIRLGSFKILAYICTVNILNIEIGWLNNIWEWCHIPLSFINRVFLIDQWLL